MYRGRIGWVSSKVGLITQRVFAPRSGSTENAGLENEGQKWNNGMKYVDRKMQYNFAGLENAGLENARQKPEDPEMNHK